MTRRRALVVQHEHDGPSGLLGERLVARGFDVHVLQVMERGSTHSDVPFPDPTAFDVVAALGSVHGVYEHDVIGSWIHRELDMLAAAHEHGVPVLGICFGAQAAAAALGGRVEPAPQAEIGWYHYDVDRSVAPDALADGPWLTWHGDRFHPPASATVLARTDLCVQAFRAGRTVGVQFHPEVTEALVRHWADHCPPGYFEARGADRDAMLAGFERHGETAAANAATLFDWFVEDVAGS